MCLWVDMCGYGFLYMCSSVQLCVAMGLLCVAMCAVSGYVWLWVAVCGYVWLWVAVCGYVWLWVTMGSYVWLCVAIGGFVWL